MRLNWTQEDLAAKAKVDHTYVSGVELGKRNLSFIVLARFADALQCDIGSLTVGIPRLPGMVG